jgi:hypothetical protein
MKGGKRAGAARKPGERGVAKATAEWEAYQLAAATRMVTSYRKGRGPDPIVHRFVGMLSALAVPPAAIAKLAGVPLATLEQHFGDALRVGRCLTRAAIITRLYERAIGGNAAALIFLERRTRVPREREQR